MEIESLKLQLKESVEKHKKEIIAKNETIRRLERECNNLKKEAVNKVSIISVLVVIYDFTYTCSQGA